LLGVVSPFRFAPLSSRVCPPGQPAETGRPAYHPSILLKLYLYGYLNRIHSSRRLGREALRNMELMWLIGRLSPDSKTIADFRRDNGPAIRNVCREFILLLLQRARYPNRGSLSHNTDQESRGVRHTKMSG
jgi:transposase